MTETENQMLFEETCGDWNEAGLVESLDRKGFTPIKGLLELFANSADKDATQIIADISLEFIKIIDDGTGMDRNSLKKMFSMHNSNNSDKKSMGVSGLGGKEGMYILSKKLNKEPTTVIVFTHQENGSYLKAIVPWKKIFDDKIYTGRITITDMTAEEIALFQSERDECQFKHGTTIKFNYNDQLKNLIEIQFYKKQLCESRISRENRSDFVFGQKIVEIILKKSDGTPNLSIEKYDYFSGNDNEYYAGKGCDIIEHWVSPKKNDVFVYHDEDGNPLYIKQTDKSCSTIPTTIDMSGSGWEKIGLYEIKNGIRCCKDIFDPTRPREPSGATMYLNTYDEKFFPKLDVEYTKECFSGCAVVRNSQFIVNIPYSDKTFNAKTSRGGFTSMFNNVYHRTEINYETESKQDNRMDKAMGIQENKNQHQKVLPLTLERLIIYLKKQHIEKVYNYFDTVIRTKAEQDKKRRENEAERRRVEEQKKRIEEEEARLLAELLNPKPVAPPSPPANIVLQLDSSSEESDDESDSDTYVPNSVDSKDSVHESTSDSECSDTESAVESPSITPQVDNLEELKRTFLEKFTAEQDYEKVKKLYEMYNTL